MTVGAPIQVEVDPDIPMAYRLLVSLQFLTTRGDINWIDKDGGFSAIIKGVRVFMWHKTRQVTLNGEDVIRDDLLHNPTISDMCNRLKETIQYSFNISFSDARTRIIDAV